MMQSSTDTSVTLSAELTEQEAYSLAELCKRIGWSDARALSVDDDECQAMITATNTLRRALGQAGIYVR